MARDGYARMSVDAVAAEAGVSKPTVYLRYPSKAALATAALAHVREQTAPGDTGDTRAGHGRDRARREHHTPELFAEFRRRLVEPRRQMLQRVLERAQLRGELAAEADLETAVNMLVGSYYANYLAGSGPRDWPRPAVELILDGLCTDKI
jgi:AcrR family transcriptional regulator